jgi:hypothetical protein
MSLLGENGNKFHPLFLAQLVKRDLDTQDRAAERAGLCTAQR